MVTLPLPRRMGVGVGGRERVGRGTRAPSSAPRLPGPGTLHQCPHPLLCLWSVRPAKKRRRRLKKRRITRRDSQRIFFLPHRAVSSAQRLKHATPLPPLPPPLHPPPLHETTRRTPSRPNRAPSSRPSASFPSLPLLQSGPTLTNSLGTDARTPGWGQGWEEA
jgi:hypothetical protein